MKAHWTKNTLWPSRETQEGLLPEKYIIKNKSAKRVIIR